MIPSQEKQHNNISDIIPFFFLHEGEELQINLESKISEFFVRYSSFYQKKKTTHPAN